MFHCQNESAVLTWTPTANAVDYFGCAHTENGGMLRCNSKEPSCVIEGLNCGTMYNFSVQASDGTCNSSFSGPVLGTAGVEKNLVVLRVNDSEFVKMQNNLCAEMWRWCKSPLKPTNQLTLHLSPLAPCPPASVQVQLFPMQNQRQVMYFSWTQINCTDTQYQLKLTGSLLGDNQALFDISSYWTSRTYFEIPLPCSSSYNATVTSRSSVGTSEPSAALSGTTGRQYSWRMTNTNSDNFEIS